MTVLSFIQGGFHSGVREEIKKRISRVTDEKKKCILLVPEQMTVIAEIEMAEHLPPSAPLTFEVTNFTRLANTAFRALGGMHLEYATHEKKALIMWRALTELSPLLYMTRARREITSGIVERAMAAMKEAHALGLDIEEINRLAGSEGISKRLEEKLSDLGKITSLYKKLLKEKYSDTDDDIALLIKKLEGEPEYLSDTEIFIEGFTSFTAPQYSLLSTLIKRCNITVALNIPKADPGAFEYSEVAKTAASLSAIADRAGVDKKIYKIDGTVGIKSELLKEIAPVLWKSNYVIDNLSLHNHDDLRIFEAKTPFDECEFVAEDIRRRVMSGSSYKDFAVIAADASRYDGVLDTALDKAEIPHFTSYKTSLLDFEAIKLIGAAIKASRGFSREDVLAYMSCGLSGITPEERDELALYVERWQISRERFTDGVVWNMHPDGFDGRITEESEALLSRIDATRVKLITPLLSLSESTAGNLTVREHATALVKFLEDIELEDGLKKRAEKLTALGFNDLAEENSRLYEIIMSALDVTVEVLDDTVTDVLTFSEELKIVFSSESIGRIPSALDEVMIGSADMLRLRDKKHVYLIGVNYGEFPEAPRDSSYFSEKDKAALASLGIDTDNVEIKVARALFTFSRAFSYASETVTLLYSVQDTSFGALIPSFVIGNVSRLTCELIKPRKISELTAHESIFSPLHASESIGSFRDSERATVTSALKKLEMDRSSGDIGNGQMSLSPSENDTLYLTQTRIDTFVSCPLQYFCKFTLALDEGERAEFGASGIGSYVHAILENFFSEVKTKSIDVAALEADERAAMTERAAKKYLAGLERELGVSPAKIKTALARILRASKPVVDGLCEEFAVSGFKPAFFELKISKDGKSGPTPTMIKGAGGEKIYIYGTIDRVDTMKKDGDVYVRVVDYKTGSKKFHPTEIAEGRNLQMFLYLKSLVECNDQAFKDMMGVGDGGEIIPAGLIYVKTEIKDQRVKSPSDEEALKMIKSSQERMGMILDDSSVYLAMGKDYIPIRLTKNGVDKRYEQYLYSRERWDEISEQIEEVVGKIGHRMRRGDIRAITGKEKSKKSPCEWCRYKAFCRNIKL